MAFETDNDEFNTRMVTVGLKKYLCQVSCGCDKCLARFKCLSNGLSGDYIDLKKDGLITIGMSIFSYEDVYPRSAQLEKRRKDVRTSQRLRQMGYD